MKHCLSDEELLFELAAKGDCEAQSFLVDYALTASDRGVPASEAACGAEMLARMAAAHGRASDRLKLAAVLLIRSDMMKADGVTDRSESMLCQAMVLLNDLASEGVNNAGGALVRLVERMADEGDEEAADLLNGIVDRMGPKAVAEARAMKKMGVG